MDDEVEILFEFRGKARHPTVMAIHTQNLVFEVHWEDDDVIYPYGKRFYINDTDVMLVGNQRPPDDAKKLHDIIFEEIMTHKSLFNI
jgi:hypothetical protein